MIGGGKKQLKKPKRSQTAKKTQDPDEFEREQHEVNTANAGLIIKHSLSKVMATGVYRALMVLLETVRPWPSLIANQDTHAFIPEFSASDIRAEEVLDGDDTVLSVSFTYSGESYDFTCRIRKADSNDDRFGSIALFENNLWVIRMDIIKSKGHEQFEFMELNAFRDGSWIKNMVQIAFEIEDHHRHIQNKAD